MIEEQRNDLKMSDWKPKELRKYEETEMVEEKKGNAKNVRDGTLMVWRDYQKAIEYVVAAWKTNAKNDEWGESRIELYQRFVGRLEGECRDSDESDESWIEVCRPTARIKFSLCNNLEVRKRRTLRER